MILLWWLFITSQLPFDYITHYNNRVKEKRQGYREIRSNQGFEYQNTRSDFKCCDYSEKNKKQYVRLQLSIPEIQGAFLDKVTPDVDGFTNETVVHQCDVQVVENTFANDSK